MTSVPPIAVTDRDFAAVLFDNDGTLTDSTAAVVRSWTMWAHEHGVDPLRLQGFHGVPAEAIVAQLLPTGDRDAALARIVAIELADTGEVRALAGAAAALGVLGSHAAIVTSAVRDLAAARLSAAGLPTPSVMITADDITVGKPDPEPFLSAAAALGVDPVECLVVEDAPSGVTAARTAGCAVVAVLTTTPESDLDADLIVPDLAHLRFVLVGDRVRVSTT